MPNEDRLEISSGDAPSAAATVAQSHAGNAGGNGQTVPLETAPVERPPARPWSVFRGDGPAPAEFSPQTLLFRIPAALWESANRRVYAAFLKRACDLLAATLLLVLLGPVIGLAWLAVRLTSRGPAIFAQQRVARGGGLFTMYKLRTMYVDQDARVDVKLIEQKQANGELHKLDRDPRVTPVGLFLRKTSIDELPQIWNVIRGDMSLIGPRPLVPYMLEPYPDIKQRRSRVRPGITGLWQVMARGDNRSALGMVKYDDHYVEQLSFTLDLFILLKTPFVVLGTRGAL